MMRHQKIISWFMSRWVMSHRKELAEIAEAEANFASQAYWCDNIARTVAGDTFQRGRTPGSRATRKHQ
jgi:hypothetical protein